VQLIVGSYDISEVVESITWSGDTKQVSRKIEFTIAQKDADQNFPKISIQEGNEAILKNDAGEVIFGGVIFDIDKIASSGSKKFLAYDLMFYVNHSSVSKEFDGQPEEITVQICEELDIPVGRLAKTGMKIYMPCLGDAAYKAIMMAYTAASKKNGKKYIPLMQNINQLAVVEKGLPCGVILDGNYNLTDANYKSTLQGLVNKVLITDENGNVVNVVEDTASQSQYGTVQTVHKQEEDTDATEEANRLLTSLEESASAIAVSDTRAISGYSIIIREPQTSLCGQFYIESDSHTFINGKAEMQLTLAFKNLMDEQEVQNQTK
jgi:hypothetical protein